MGVRADRAVGTPRPAQTWWSFGAAVLGLGAGAQLIAWANRWYVTEQFARSAGTADGIAWQGLYLRLHQTHATLVTGLVLLLLAGACAGLAVRAHRAARS